MRLASLELAAPLETRGRTIWAWFLAWPSTPEPNATPSPRTCVQIGLFADEYHDSYAPGNPIPAVVLGLAPPEVLEALLNRAFDACRELPPEEIVQPRHPVPVSALQRAWSKQLNRPAEHRAGAATASEHEEQRIVEQTLAEASSGDRGAHALVAGVAAARDGRYEDALRIFEEGAQFGDVDCMLSAATVAQILQNAGVSKFWNEQAAEAGDPKGMFNLGIAALETNELTTASQWFQQAASAGNAEAYAALIEVAEREGDDSAARQWAETGARLDNPRCLEQYALHILRGNEQDPMIRSKHIALMENAARQGFVPAMDRCGIYYYHHGNPVQAKYWLEQAVAGGDCDAGERLIRYGLA